MNDSILKLKELLLSQSFISGVMNVLVAIVMFVVGFWIVGKVMGIVTKALDKSNINEELKPFITSMLSILLKILVLLIVAGKVGIDTSSIVAALAAASFAIGMALQGSLGHIAAGILLLLFKHYKIGDYITVGDHSGFVEEIQIINTVIRTFDNQLVIIPNGTAVGESIVNSSGTDGYIRQEFMVNMPYNESYDKVEKTILEALNSTSNVLSDPKPEIGIAEFDTHFIKVSVKPYSKVRDQEQVFFEATTNVKKALGKAGIKMAYSEDVAFGEISAG